LTFNRSVKNRPSIIDATIAMEGNGPTAGSLVDMGLIIAGILVHLQLNMSRHFNYGV